MRDGALIRVVCTICRHGPVEETYLGVVEDETKLSERLWLRWRGCRGPSVERRGQQLGDFIVIAVAVAVAVVVAVAAAVNHVRVCDR